MTKRLNPRFYHGKYFQTLVEHKNYHRPELYRGKITPRKVREELPLDLSEGQAENIEDFSVSKPNCMTCHQ
jgi:hypothetical protein